MQTLLSFLIVHFTMNLYAFSLNPFWNTI
jgi:hypothetical protein